MTSVGFIGLGTMGGPMALNIVKGGYKVKGFDMVGQCVTWLLIIFHTVIVIAT